MRKEFIAGIVLLIGIMGFDQGGKAGARDTPDIQDTDSLYALYGQNKILPPGYERQALLALSHYPELRDVHIRFILKDAFIPLASRPYIFSLFSDRYSRRYKVIISDGSLEVMDPILLKNLPFNAQVAILGHELAHAVHYQEMSVYGIQFVGLAYFCPFFRAWFEKSTDRRTIEYGLGPELLEYAEYVRQVLRAEGRETGFIDRYYMDPAEIKKVMSSLR